jgi:hypothetical protein
MCTAGILLALRYLMVLAAAALSPPPLLLLLQAFQCSAQAVQLHSDGWFCSEDKPSGVSRMKNPKEPSVEQAVIVASK